MSDLYVGYNRACRHPDTLTHDEKEYRHAIMLQGLTRQETYGISHVELSQFASLQGKTSAHAICPP